MNPHGHQGGNRRVEQVRRRHGPERIGGDAERGRGARVEGPPHVGPLALEGVADTAAQTLYIIIYYIIYSSDLMQLHKLLYKS